MHQGGSRIPSRPLRWSSPTTRESSQQPICCYSFPIHTVSYLESGRHCVLHNCIFLYGGALLPHRLAHSNKYACWSSFPTHTVSHLEGGRHCILPILTATEQKTLIHQSDVIVLIVVDPIICPENLGSEHRDRMRHTHTDWSSWIKRS